MSPAPSRILTSSDAEWHCDLETDCACTPREMATCEFSRPRYRAATSAPPKDVHSRHQPRTERWTLANVPSWAILLFLLAVFLAGYLVGTLFRMG